MNATVSVVMTTYEGDDPQELQECFISLNNQIRKPDELIIVRDRKLPSELTTQIKDFEERSEFSVRDVSVEERGRGHARGIGVKKAESELVAIIDADDIACPNRLKRQLEYFESNPSTDAVGGYIGEFSDDPDDIETVREVPTTPDQIRSMARFRCPLNHPAVMFRRSAVLEVGNYRPLRSIQDYDLWMRMLASGYRLSNIPNILVKCKAGERLFQRRGGIDYLKIEFQLQYEFLQMNLISLPIFLLNVFVRCLLRISPNNIRKKVYQYLLRD
jgi:glycosyltransferase involved in cell wall biosynthesis